MARRRTSSPPQRYQKLLARPSRVTVPDKVLRRAAWLETRQYFRPSHVEMEFIFIPKDDLGAYRSAAAAARAQSTAAPPQRSPAALTGLSLTGIACGTNGVTLSAAWPANTVIAGEALDIFFSRSLRPQAWTNQWQAGVEPAAGAVDIIIPGSALPPAPEALPAACYTNTAPSAYAPGVTHTNIVCTNAVRQSVTGFFRLADLADTDGDGLTDAVEIWTHGTNPALADTDGDGRVMATWGATYPVACEYDPWGRMIAMSTTRDPAHANRNRWELMGYNLLLSGTDNPDYPAALDTTLWRYDTPTGLLTNKVYADGNGTAYAYTPEGKLATRTWARGVTTSYGYDSAGALASIVYSDGTPGVTFQYDRLGRMTSAIVAGVSTNHFEYDGFRLASETQNGVVISRTTDALGRDTGFLLDEGYEVSYAYDMFGRFHSVSSSVASVAAYSYLPGTDLICGMTNSAGFHWSRAYEPQRNLIASVENGFNSGTVSRFDYLNRWPIPSPTASAQRLVPRLYRPFRASLFSPRYPGRCPGLVYRAPSGLASTLSRTWSVTLSPSSKAKD